MDYRTTYGIYDDEEILLKAVRDLKREGVKITEVFTPFPVHGLDKALGLKETRLSIASFIYGITGLGLGIFMMWYMLIHDWPVNIGGKPNFSLAQNFTSFIPPAFEMIVLCAAHGMVLTFLLRSRLVPGFKAKNPFPETTSHEFAVELAQDNNKEKIQLHQILRETGAIEVREHEKN